MSVMRTCHKGENKALLALLVCIYEYDRFIPKESYDIYGNVHWILAELDRIWYEY